MNLETKVEDRQSFRSVKGERMAKKKFTAKQIAWRGMVAIAVALCCVLAAPLLAISDQPDTLDAINAYQEYAETTEVEPMAVQVAEEAASVQDEISTPTSGVDEGTPTTQASAVADEDETLSVQSEEEVVEEEAAATLSTQSLGIASIGSASYDSLQDAVNAAKNGDTVLLNEDVRECITVSSAKSFVLDMQKHTLDANNAGTAFYVSVDGCNVTLKNGTIINGKFNSTAKGSGFAAPKKNAAITIDNVTFLNNDPTNGYAVAVGGNNVDLNGVTNITNCNVSGSAGGMYIANKQSVTVTNVEIFNNVAAGGMASAKEQLYIRGLKGVSYTMTNVKIHDNDMRKNGNSIATVKVSTGNYEFKDCRIENNTAVNVAGIYKESGTSLVLDNTVVANNTCTSTAKPTSSNPYTGGLGCILAKSSATPTPTVTVKGGAIYGNTKNGSPSDAFMTAASNRYGFGFDVVDILSASSMSDSQLGGNSYFKSYGFEWSIDEASTATYGFTTEVAKSAIQSDGRIAFDTKVYPKVASTTSPGITFFVHATTEPTPVASVGDANYESLAAAFEAANDGDTVKLYAEENSDKNVPVALNGAESINVNKNVTFDANGRFVSGSATFQVSNNAHFTLCNTGEGISVNSGFILNNEGVVVLEDGVDVGSISNNGNGRLEIEGSHGVCSISILNNNPVQMKEGATAESLNITLSQDTLNSINNEKFKGDIKLIECSSDADAESLLADGKVTVLGKSTPLAVLTTDGQNIVIHMIDAKAVYVGGPLGNNNNSGFSPDDPVASFDAAQSRLATAKEKKIFVVGEIAVNENASWGLEVGEIERYADYKGALVRVSNGASLTLNNVTLNGGSCEMENRDIRNNGGWMLKQGVTADAPLVIVDKGASLTVADGALLHSNQNDKGSVCGGAIHNEGTLEITGGTITDNKSKHAGGGVYSYSDGMTISGGTISHNQTIAAPDITGADAVQSAGGGICVAKGELSMSGGVVENNKAVGKNCKGGGISIGGDALRNNISFVMTGGEVKKNSSYGVGGGICLDSNAVGTITAGTISDNVCNDGTNVNDAQYTYWGGGGIYVEGPRNGEPAAKLHLENVEIADNSGSTGSGISACPTARDVRINIKDGAVIHDNKNGNDVTIATNALTETGATYVTLPKYTANGYKYNWLNAEGKVASTEELNKVYTSTTGGASFKSQLTGENAKKAAENCTVKITGNRSGSGSSYYPGGGIGANGYLSIGNSDTNFALEKKVEGDADPMYNEFEFEIAFTEGDSNDPYVGNVTYYKGGGDRADVEAVKVQTDEAGILSVSLKADEYLLIRDLPAYLKYKVKEVTKSSSTILQGSVSDTEATPDISNSVVDGKLEWTVENNGIYESTSNDSGVLKNGFNELVITNEYLLGELTINKKLEGAVSTMANGEGNSTAVFHVEGTWGEGENAQKIYDNYVAINFSKPDEASATLHGLLVGANYTVTEVVPSGSGYAIKEGTEPVQVGVLNKAEDNGTAKVSFSFENILDNEDHPNHGIINTYNYDNDAQKLRVSIQGALDALAGN